MQVGRVDIPCGCQQRKEVMFTQGQPDLALAVIVGLPLAVVLFLLIKGKVT